ncbi:MAG: hypothetical protein MUC50_02200 [Myxococcota bacterium]|jgi:F-type H+-transporting ATPase subunit b|nr:hypothetical protein [Myxococcota bacterium]
MKNPSLPFATALATLAASISAALPVCASAAKGAHEASHDAINWFDFGAWWSEGANPPFVAVLINFAIMCWLVYKILKPGLSRRFADRRDSVQSALEEAARLKAAAQEAMADAQARIDSLQSEMEKLKEQTIEGGRAEAARIVQEAQRRAERLHNDAEIALAQEMASLKTALREELAEKVSLATLGLLRQQLTPADQEKLTQEYLDAISPASRVSRPPAQTTRS